MQLSYEVHTVRTRHRFVIARGGTVEHRLVRVRLLDDDGYEGFGEAAPNRFYGETPDTAVAALERLRPVIEEGDAWSLDALEAEMNRALRFNPSVKSAVSVAAHDIVARRLGVPLYRMWGLDPSTAPRSSFTIAITPNPDELRRRVEEAEQYPILKVKLGSDHDAEIIRTVRMAAPDKILRVDANAAWSAKHALMMIELLMDYDVEFVEQPVAAHDLDALRFVRERSPLPVIADESCLVATDVARLAGIADGINIKLAKCGGLREALKMIHTARAHGMRVMCGCMIESSLGITAAAHLAPLLDAADLDGAALLAEDPWMGATIDEGVIRLPEVAGIGARPRA